MALGIRYPKAHSQGHVRSSALGSNNPGMTAFLSGQYARLDGTAPFLLNPKRYSEVRKVVFWMCGTLLDSTPPAINARLRIAISSATGNKSAPSVATIAPGDAVRIRGSSSVFPNAPSTEAQIYDHVGDYAACSSISTFADRTSTLWTIEFDRFEPGHEDFFNAWDELAANNLDDEYCLVHPIMEADAAGDSWAVGSATTNFVFYECGVSVVQAPSTINRTSTIINTNIGWISYGSEATSFGTPRAWPFRYLAADWDNVTSMHVWSFLPFSGGADTWDMQLEVGAMQHEGGAITSTSRYNESFSDGIGIANVDAVHRSQNILPWISDGDFLGIEWRKLSAGSMGQPTGYIEIVQVDFVKTVCPHVGSVSGPQAVTEITEPEQYGYGKAFFDPTWYQSFPEDRVLSSRVWSGLKHSSAAYDPTQKVVINANEQADWATSPFSVVVAPENTGTPV
ncbi:MAG TPA: hypothetical protein VMW94_02335, partial [Actinomycetes bacterium]|nr:hypothetical protein [Actinomycetes bacterium]